MRPGMFKMPHKNTQKKLTQVVVVVVVTKSPEMKASQFLQMSWRKWSSLWRPSSRRASQPAGEQRQSRQVNLPFKAHKATNLGGRNDRRKCPRRHSLHVVWLGPSLQVPIQWHLASWRPAKPKGKHHSRWPNKVAAFVKDSARLPT